MFSIDHADHHDPWFINCSGRQFNPVYVIPERLRLNKVNPMLVFIGGTLIRIKFKIHNCIESILFRLFYQS